MCSSKSQPMGHQNLAGVVSDIAKHLDLKGKITNHSLRVTAASRLHQQNIDEQLVVEHTGHHSTCVHSYKCTSSNQMCGLSDMLYGNPTQSFTSDVQQSDADSDGVSAKKPYVVEECKTRDEMSAQVNYNQQNTMPMSGADTKSVSFNFTVNINK